MIKLEPTRSMIQSMELKCYPHVLHFIKAHGINMEIPNTIFGIKDKLKNIVDLAKEMETKQKMLLGFQF